MLNQEKIRRPAPTKVPRRIERPSNNGWKVVRMEMPTNGDSLTSSTVAGYADKSESACRLKAGELNGKVKLGESAPLVSYIATRNEKS